VLRLPEAIGLQLVDELCLLWIMIFCAGYFVATLVFGIVWWIAKNDVQGAFAAAGFFASFLGVVALGVTSTFASME
jgi:uncharacterized membrane protein YvlD (DUF360 family)